jgi:hypothetical protein
MEGKLRHGQCERALAELATRQHGVASHAQLLGLGFGGRWIERRLVEGRLQAVHRNVYAVGHSRLTRRSRWWAAVLAYGPDALLSHRTAAVLWGFQRPQREPIHVTAGCGRQGIQRREGIWIHRCKLAPVDRATRDGFPVTTVARTLFDLAEVVPFESLKGGAEEADRLKLLRLRELEETCERGRGRRALRPVRRLLMELGVPDEGRSPLEIRFPASSGSTGPLSHFRRSSNHKVDVLWSPINPVIEPG